MRWSQRSYSISIHVGVIAIPLVGWVFLASCQLRWLDRVFAGDLERAKGVLLASAESFVSDFNDRIDALDRMARDGEALIHDISLIKSCVTLVPSDWDRGRSWELERKQLPAWGPQLVAKWFGQESQHDYAFQVDVLAPEEERSLSTELDVKGGRRSVAWSSDPNAPPLLEEECDVVVDLIRPRSVWFQQANTEEWIPISPRVVTPPAPSRQLPGFRLLVRHRMGSLAEVFASRRNRYRVVVGSVFASLLASGVFLFVSVLRARRVAATQLAFVAGVSHELRTPLATIRAAADNLADGIVTGPEKMVEYGELLGQEACRLESLVSQVLSFSAVAASNETADAIDVDRLVADVMTSLRNMPGSERVSVFVEPLLPTLLGNREDLHSAIANLVSNAIKFGQSEVEVSVRQVADELEIVVVDDGDGVAPNETERIFDPFFRGATAIERQVEGTGLGLAIVERVVKRHQGKVQLNRGASDRDGRERTRFTLLLPVGRSVIESESLARSGDGETST